MAKRRILVAPLNWGLGHATRCIPIIKALIAQGYEPVIASDGDALSLLKEEFPGLENYELPAYNIKYASNAFFFRSKLFLQTPHILRTISLEGKATSRFVKEMNLSGIISDSRWGVRHEKVPSVFITHQVNVLSGLTTFLTSRIHRWFIQKFDECWVPDNEGSINLSGRLGHPVKNDLNLRYIGILSRFKKQDLPIKYDIAVILSGPEPQRSLFEDILNKELRGRDLKILMVRGVVEGEQICIQEQNQTIYNFLTSAELENKINQSSLVVCRPGYTSLMDLAILQKKAFLIPTPGQYEQEYLFKKLFKEGLVAGCSQKEFKFDLLSDAKARSLGFILSGTGLNGIFSLFKGE